MLSSIAFIIALLLGVPIAFVMGLAALLLMATAGTATLIGFPQRMFVGINKFVLMAIPFFILAGILMNEGGMTRRLVKFAQCVVGWVHGGLAMTTIFAEMILSGITGSAQADAAALGSVLIPAMRKEGYDAEYSAGLVAAAAVMGPIIPPSIIMIILAVVADLSVGALFLAGMIPGILIGLSLMALAYYYARKRNYPRGNRPTARELFASLVDAILALLMIVIMLGGILTGFFTPTEAAAVAVAYAFVVGFFVFKELRLSSLPRILLETAVINCGIMFIFGTAYLLSWMITFIDVPQLISARVVAFADTPWLFLLTVNVLLLFVGTWMDPGAALIVLVPALLPAATNLGIHPIHFGIIVCMNLVIGMVTPPVGYVLYTLVPIAKMSMERISRGLIPFLLVEIAVLFTVSYLPSLTLALPRLFGLID